MSRHDVGSRRPAARTRAARGQKGGSSRGGGGSGSGWSAGSWRNGRAGMWMRWPQAVIQSQDPSRLAVLDAGVAGGLVLVVGDADPAGVARGRRVRRGRGGVVHLHPARVAAGAAGCAAAAVAGEDVGPQRCGQVGEGAVVEQVAVDGVGHHAAERVRVAGELASDLGGDGLSVEQAVPVGLAPQGLQVDDELHLRGRGVGCQSMSPVSAVVPRIRAASASARHAPMRTPSASSMADRTTSRSRTPTPPLAVLTGGDRRLAHLVRCRAPLRP